jgi:hypothetical protein
MKKQLKWDMENSPGENLEPIEKALKSMVKSTQDSKDSINGKQIIVTIYVDCEMVIQFGYPSDMTDDLNKNVLVKFESQVINTSGSTECHGDQFTSETSGLESWTVEGVDVDWLIEVDVMCSIENSLEQKFYTVFKPSKDK